MLKARGASEAESHRAQGAAPCDLRTSEFSDWILIIAQLTTGVRVGPHRMRCIPNDQSLASLTFSLTTVANPAFSILRAELTVWPAGNIGLLGNSGFHGTLCQSVFGKYCRLNQCFCYSCRLYDVSFESK